MAKVNPFKYGSYRACLAGQTGSDFLKSKTMSHWQRGMRDAFFDALFNLARKDKNVILITADIGAVCHNEFRQKLPKQYINIGVAEQNMIGVAAGLALAGKIVYVYSIIPFVTMRCYEQIRVDLCVMNLPVTVVGIGAGFDYSTLGPTHHATEDIGLMRLLPNMSIYSPSDSVIAGLLAKACHKQPGPKYIRLDRQGLPLLYKKEKEINISRGLSLLKTGKDLYIISTGRMVYEALNIAKALSRYSISAGVIDLFKIKPVEEQNFWSVIKGTDYIATLEEHFITGGIGSIISEMFARDNNAPRLKSFGIPDKFCRRYGPREYLRCINKIGVNSVTESIKAWIKK